MRAVTFLVLACAGLAACGEAPAGVASTSGLPADASQPTHHALAPLPATPAGLNVADFMYGPPPHNRIDPRMRCRFDCPTYPANLPPPVR